MMFRDRALHVEIDFRTSRMTILQVLDAVEKLKQQYPDREIYMDGDLYAIVSAEYMDQYTLDDFGGVA